jgi:hypothetical protein
MSDGLKAAHKGLVFAVHESDKQLKLIEAILQSEGYEFSSA